MSLYTYRFRLYPKKQQEELLEKHFGCVRYIYNYFLNRRIEAYKFDSTGLNYFDTAKELTILKKGLTWLNEIGCHSLQFALQNLQSAYDKFFKKVRQKIKGNKGFPKFKSKNSRQSFRAIQRVKLKGDKIYISKFREGIKLRKNREVEGKIKYFTIIKERGGNYYVSIVVDKNIEVNSKLDKKIIAIDLNIDKIVLSDGTQHNNPLPETTIYKKKLRFLSQKFTRSKKGGGGRKKIKLRLNKLRNKIRNIREDFLHKLSCKIVNENQVIIIENLAVLSLLQKKHQHIKKSKAIHRKLQDAGFGSLIQKLEYKSAWYNVNLIKVACNFPSSKLCSNCHYKNEKLLDEKTWICEHCLVSHNRDENAAKNILNEGMRLLALKTDGVAGLAECPDISPTIVG